MTEEPSPLEQAVREARLLALAPEQGLLRMLAQRRASRRALQAAITSYRRAADVLDAALTRLTTNSKDKPE